MCNYKWFWLILLCLSPFSLFSDALMVSQAMKASTIAEVFIEREAVRVEVEIGLGDIPAFRNILPDAIYEKLGNAPAPIAQRLELFFSEDFVIETAGTPLDGGVLRMEPRVRMKRDDVTGEALPNQGEGQDILFVELIYPIEGNPSSLSIKPPTDQDSGFVSATVGLMTYHMGLPVMDFRYLGRKETIQLDWEDPWYSKFENKNLSRQYNEAINAFLYIEPFETRVEIIVRPKDMQEWLDLGIEGLQTIPVDLQADLKEKIAAFLPTQMVLEVDGDMVTPKLDRMNFLKRTLRSSVVIDPPEELDAISATLGLIYSIPTESLPKKAALTWNLFSPKMQEVRSAATDEAGPLPYKLRPDDHVLVWNNYLKNPTIPGIKELDLPQLQRKVSISIGLPIILIIMIPLGIVLYRRKGRLAALVGMVLLYTIAIFVLPVLPRLAFPIPGKALLSEENQRALVSGLLGNIYASFDFNGESAVYDALDHSLSGDLLSRVYLETMKSLELKSQGGARVKVKDVILHNASFKEEGTSFFATCTWDVRGSVGHWGHVHERINQYTADLHIEPVDGAWKISQLDIRQEQRVK